MTSLQEPSNIAVYQLWASILMSFIAAASVIITAWLARKTNTDNLLTKKQAEKEEAETESIYQEMARKATEANKVLLEANLALSEANTKLIAANTRLMSNDEECLKFKKELASLQKRVLELETELARYISAHGRLPNE